MIHLNEQQIRHELDRVHEQKPLSRTYLMRRYGLTDEQARISLTMLHKLFDEENLDGVEAYFEPMEVNL